MPYTALMPFVRPRALALRLASALTIIAALLGASDADACTSSAQCTAPSVCSPTTHTCVGCFDDTPCRGPAPVCNVAAGFCSSCQSDHGAGPAACPAAHPACVTSGSKAGECADCSGTNSTACSTATRPLCDVVRNVCGCGVDTDCGAGLYCDHDVAPEGWCVFGCHVIGGVDRCATGSHCDARDGSIGNCKPGSCSIDADCGGVTSGRICAANSCVDGCRGVAGNGCAAPLVCTSTDDSAGQCTTHHDPPDASAPDASAGADAADADATPIVSHGLSAGCAIGAAPSDGAGLAFAFLAGALTVARARRRR